jgi:Skp family chaperone for outer membrane proteins
MPIWNAIKTWGRKMLQRLVTIIGLVGLFYAGAAAEMPVGLVDTERIMEAEPRFVQAQREIDQMVDQFDGDRKKFEEELQDLSGRLQRAQENGREGSVDLYQRQLGEKTQVYQQFMTETYGPDGIIETNTSEIMDPLYDKLELACKNVGQQLAIPLILDRGTLGPLYAADTLDITDEVLAELKKIR